MFKTILATATAALIAAAIAAPAHAVIRPNGAELNGIRPNGAEFNGIRPNGAEFNGIRPNGMGWNGHVAKGTAVATPSVALEGIELPAAVR